MPKITSLDALSRLKVDLVMKRNQEAYRGAVYVSVGMATLRTVECNVTHHAHPASRNVTTVGQNVRDALTGAYPRTAPTPPGRQYAANCVTG